MASTQGMEATDKPTRRGFLNIILGTGVLAWIGAVFYPIAKYLVPPRVSDTNVNNMEAGTLAEFPALSSKIIRFGRKPVIVVRQRNGDFHALAATCTHMDCTVQFKTDTEQIWCACHNGFYDLQGKNLSGPPPKPLAQYQVTIRQEKVIITKEELA